MIALGATGLGALHRPARACEFFSSHLRIWHPWTRATRVDADTARLCMRFDEVQTSDRLIGVKTPVAGGPGWPGRARRRARRACRWPSPRARS